MKSFFRDNSYYITRLLITQVGLTVFGLMLSLATATIGDGTTLFAFASVFSILFYLGLVYSTMWEAGNKMAERIIAGRAAIPRLYGAKIGCTAYIPNFIILALLWVGFVFGSETLPFAREWAGGMYKIADLLLTGLFAMYRGLDRVIIEAYAPEGTAALFNAVFYTASMLPGIIVSGIAYSLGCRGIALFSKPKPSVE